MALHKKESISKNIEPAKGTFHKYEDWMRTAPLLNVDVDLLACLPAVGDADMQPQVPQNCCCATNCQSALRKKLQ